MLAPRSLHIIGGVALGGAERFFIRLVNALHRHGAPVAAITTAGGEIAAAVDPGIPHYHAPQWATWDFYSRWKIRRAIRAFDPDIVQTYMGRATRIVHLRPGIRPVHVARLGGYYNLKGYRHAHAWVGNTKGIENYLLQAGLPAEQVCHIGNFAGEANPVSQKAFATLRNQFGIPHNARCLVGIGRLHVNKGWADLLDAFSRLPAELDSRPLWLVMVGDGPLNGILRAQAERLGIASRLCWAGWQKNPDPWYQLADILVCASRHEPLGNVILEAWANHALIVSTRSDGPSELITDGIEGLLTQVGDASAMQQNLLKALQLPASQRQAIIDAGQRKLNLYFSEEAIVRQYLNWYRTLLSRLP